MIGAPWSVDLQPERLDHRRPESNIGFEATPEFLGRRVGTGFEGAAEQNGVAVRTGAGDRSGTRQQHEQEALQQGHLAVSSILRDWIKGQITAVECGILSFEAVFMPHMLTNDGRPLLERVQELLPKADEPKVVQIPHKPDAA